MHRVRSRGAGPAAMRCDRRSRCIRPDPAFQPGFAAHCLSRWTLCGGGSRIQSESIRYSASPQSRAGASRRDPLSLCRLTPPALHIYMCVQPRNPCRTRNGDPTSPEWCLANEGAVRAEVKPASLEPLLHENHNAPDGCIRNSTHGLQGAFMLRYSAVHLLNVRRCVARQYSRSAIKHDPGTHYHRKRRIA